LPELELELIAPAVIRSGAEIVIEPPLVTPEEFRLPVVTAELLLVRVISPPALDVVLELRAAVVISPWALRVILPPALVVEEESRIPAELMVAPLREMLPPSVLTAPSIFKAPGLVRLKAPPWVDRLIELPKVQPEATARVTSLPPVLILDPVGDPKILLRGFTFPIKIAAPFVEILAGKLRIPGVLMVSAPPPNPAVEPELTESLKVMLPRALILIAPPSPVADVELTRPKVTSVPLLNEISPP
jgi:hypothetical protein